MHPSKAKVNVPASSRVLSAHLKLAEAKEKTQECWNPANGVEGTSVQKETEYTLHTWSDSLSLLLQPDKFFIYSIDDDDGRERDPQQKSPSL